MPRHRHHHARNHRLDPRRAASRVAISLGCGLAAYLGFAPRLPDAVAALLAVDVASLALLALSWSLFTRADAEMTQMRAGAEDPGRTLVYFIVVLGSSASLLAATLLVGNVRSMTTPLLKNLGVALCLATVALSWVMSHTAFAFRYAHLYYREDAEGVGGVEFPGKQPPRYLDFAYLAFTVGMCFQVSDVCVTSPQIRSTVLLHSIISFAYNTILLAFVLNLVFGLAGAAS